MKLILFLLLLIAPLVGYAQEPFKITIVNTTDRVTPRLPAKAFYEDEKYLVRKTCSGELGGTVYFKNKQTNQEYCCAAMCPVSVSRLNGVYYVSCYLHHFADLASVLKIPAPDSMDFWKEPATDHPNDRESHSMKGTSTVLDTGGIVILASFPWKNRLYHVTSDHKNTYISLIENRAFVPVQILYHHPVRPDGDVVRLADEELSIPFKGLNSSGSIEVRGNQIYLNQLVTAPEK
ncbi:hypothetical protein [Chitinophaga sp. sic0106]|uniref:hypothetical protein n=1 Tax=Chitinophaga sp. sic0106 TaxID=2854785 RepID=UPI001C4810FC|nr:hypothetical protein [Chitinophaga sp. sic0106]MBV7529620.1 hypothetical protein [Chitinophaga sp. sic0106]